MPQGGGQGRGGQGGEFGAGGGGRGGGGPGSRGRRGGGAGLGPGGDCVCRSCGTVVPHQPGYPCNQMKCPKCGSGMTRKV